MMCRPSGMENEQSTLEVEWRGGGVLGVNSVQRRF